MQIYDPNKGIEVILQKNEEFLFYSGGLNFTGHLVYFQEKPEKWRAPHLTCVSQF